jgi:hypothetical protein
MTDGPKFAYVTCIATTPEALWRAHRDAGLRKARGSPT